MGRVVHFEITADQPARAKKFYETVFDWKIKDSGMPGIDYLMCTTGPKDDMGSDGAIMPKTYRQQPVINTVAVDNLEASMKAVEAAGGKLVGDKQQIPGVGDFHYAEDTEGNLVGMLKPLPRQS